MATFAAKISSWLTVLSQPDQQRGQPQALGPAQRRPLPAMRVYPPFGVVARAPSRDYTRPPDSFKWLGGQVDYDPVGAGVVATKKLPIHMGDSPVGTYVAGEIFWNTTVQAAANNAAAQPALYPLYDPATLYAMLGPVSAQAVAPPPAVPLY